DWHNRYNIKPVLMETFVDSDRFTGACYRAANWNHVGKTQGRGKLEKSKQQVVPIKEIFLYPNQ
ncbi:MAG: Druantia anti-phage system protein DruA, partial [Verrucomicrobiota bacterium]